MLACCNMYLTFEENFQELSRKHVATGRVGVVEERKNENGVYGHVHKQLRS